MDEPALVDLLNRAFHLREPLLDPRHETALRLFNGFTEGCPSLVVDLYADTGVIHDYSDPPTVDARPTQVALALLQDRFLWVRAVVVKLRNSPSQAQRRGTLAFGSNPAGKIIEHDVWYAVDLMLNRDSSFYLDTRNLRRWAIDRLSGLTVLNTFAYTGSLGVAARAAAARRVVQLERNGRFLEVARASYALNGWPAPGKDLRHADFFRQVAQYRRSKQRFDCVFVDPPFFATSATGTIDLEHQTGRLLNKLRPVVNPGGYLVAVNNSLYLSGSAYLRSLEDLCQDGYVSILEFVPVPQDVVGLLPAVTGFRIPDPAPFNHSTKIAILQIAP
jgi:23S rRNA (cytosine1962-C5)-methyltransferase